MLELARLVQILDRMLEAWPVQDGRHRVGGRPVRAQELVDNGSGGSSGRAISWPGAAVDDEAVRHRRRPDTLRKRPQVRSRPREVVHRSRSLLPLRLLADLRQLQRELLHGAVQFHSSNWAGGPLDPARSASGCCSPPQPVHLLLEVLHLLDGGHASIGLLGELALDVPARAFRAARRLGGVALDLPLPAGVAAGILSPLPVRSLGLDVARELCV